MARERSSVLFIDESSTGKSEMMAIGGLAMSLQDCVSLEQRIDEWCHENGMRQELKFRNVCSSNSARYCDFSTRLFKAIHANRARFRALVVENGTWKTSEYGGFEGVYHRLVYQLVLHCFGDLYANGDRVVVKLDERGSNYDLNYLKEVLNRAMRCNYSGWSPVVSVEWHDSKASRLMQAADILTSAVGFDCNNRESLTGISDAKLAVMRSIRECAGLESLKTNTPKGQSSFGVWQFKFKNRR